MFVFLTLIGVLALTSALAVYSDVKSDGYSVERNHEIIRFS